MSHEASAFDRSAAVTRSLLGWGVVAGPFYMVVGVALALTRPGFNIGVHALSLLTLGDFGWMQRANLILSGLMVLAAAYGVLRAIRNGRGLAIGTLVGIYGIGMVFSAIFLPDPVPGFPPGSAGGAVSTGGILHLVFGAVGFICLSIAAFTYARWTARRGEAGQARFGLACAIVVILGFIGGAILAQSAVGIALLWIAVVAGWLWLALASAHLYTVVPHPVAAHRPTPAEA